MLPNFAPPPDLPPGTPLEYMPTVIDSLVLTPTNGSLIATLGATTLEGAASADGYLKQLTLSVDGATVHTFNWPDGAARRHHLELGLDAAIGGHVRPQHGRRGLGRPRRD